MGRIYELSKFIAIASDNLIIVICKSTFEAAILKLPAKSLKKKNEREKKLDSNSSKRSDIVHIVSSKDEQYIVAATSDKRLIIWNLSTLQFVKEEQLLKRPVAISLSMDLDVIVADKAGDVYVFNVKDSDVEPCKPQEPLNPAIDVEPGPDPVLGHVSMLLDMVLTEDENFVITCDRDEKIRVSCYPNCYNIHIFCLGHTEFVSQIKQIPKSKNLIVSASGDGIVKIWNYMEGEEVASLDVRLQLKESYGNCEVPVDTSENSEEGQTKNEGKPSTSISTFVSVLQCSYVQKDTHILAFAFYRLPVVLFYELKNGKDFRFLKYHITDMPPIDIVFLESGQVLVYYGDSKIPFSVLAFSQDFTQIESVNDSPILKLGQSMGCKLKATDVWQPTASSLYKVRFDNNATYLMKKQQRIDGAKDKARKRKSSD